jgi:arylsulfatase A-like enzyme
MWIVPGVTRPGGVCNRTVDYMQIYPTLCDLAGLPVPKQVEGESIRTLLEKPDAPWDKPAITTWLYNNHTVRTERWRYIRYDDGSEELYDHDRDPLEWNNLAQNPEYAPIKADLAKWLPKENKPWPERVAKEPGRKARKAGKKNTKDE